MLGSLLYLVTFRKKKYIINVLNAQFHSGVQRKMSIKTSLLDMIKQQNYSGFAEINVADIIFEPMFRDMCVMNSCGKFGTSWVCPPACGDYESMKARVCGYTHGVLVQQFYTLADSFDFEGMMAGQGNFDQRFYAVIDALNNSKLKNWDALKAGTCSICKKCSYPDVPCLFPNRAKSSLEACGINVSALCTQCGLSYINGQNTVTYFALFVYSLG